MFLRDERVEEEEALEVLEAAGLVEEDEELEEVERTFIGAGVAEARVEEEEAEAFLEETEAETFLEEEAAAEAFLEEEEEAEAFLEEAEVEAEAIVAVVEEEEVAAPASLDFSASLMSLADPNAGMPYLGSFSLCQFSSALIHRILSSFSSKLFYKPAGRFSPPTISRASLPILLSAALDLSQTQHRCALSFSTVALCSAVLFSLYFC